MSVLDTNVVDMAEGAPPRGHGAVRASRPLTLSIAAVERDTGLSKDTLRVWERRYGFPAPQRDRHGERAYPLEQVEKLRTVKRLLDAGHRPGRIVSLPSEDLQRLAASMPDQRPPVPGRALAVTPSDLQPYLDRLRAHDIVGLRRALARGLARAGLGRFVDEVVAPLAAVAGEAWVRGELEVYQEHALTESLQSVLRHALAAWPEPDAGARPRVLLTTFPGEPHGLGLLMAEATLAVEGAACVSLGVQTPLWDIVLAAEAYRADVVAIGFTASVNPNHILDGLAELRAKLPATTALWAGGVLPLLQRHAVEGVDAMPTLDALVAAVHAWRAARR
jgi:methylmalonyl-CoA mutase cobalamin-binding subunit